MSTTQANPGELNIRLDRLFVPENVRALDLEWVARLRTSIRARGRIVVPLTVIDADPAVHGEEYDHVLVAGFHRVHAAREEGLNTVPGSYGEPEYEEADRAIENVTRKDPNPYEEARAVQAALARGFTQAGVAEMLGWDPHRVTARVKLLQLPVRAQQLVGNGTIAASAVDAMRHIGDCNPAVLDLTVEYIAEHPQEFGPNELVRLPLGMVLNAVSATESDVFAAPLDQVPMDEAALLPDDEPTAALLTEARDLYKQLHPFSWGEPIVRFTEAETDRARAAGVLLELGVETPLVTDFAVYQDLCRTAIDAAVASFKGQVAQRAAEDPFGGGQGGQTKEQTTREDELEKLHADHRRAVRKLAVTAHSANLDLGDKLRDGLNVVDTDDMNVARFFVYAVLGADNKGLYARDNLAAAIALRGIRLVIPEFREDLTKTRKDGSAGALRITYGPGVSHVNQSEWLWKYLDGARSAGELYGRALIVIAAEHYASRLVIPASQHELALSWRSHENIALQALTKLAGPHIAPTLEALRKAVAKAESEYEEDRMALLTGTSRSDKEDPDAEDSDPPQHPAPADGQQELLAADDPPLADTHPEDLPAPVDASKFEPVNEGPAPMVDPPEAAVEDDDVVDAAADIDF